MSGQNIRLIVTRVFIFIFLLLFFAGCAGDGEKTMKDFGIHATNLFLYYKDLDRAAQFYTETLGIEKVADYGMAKILRVASASYLILVDASKGMHSAEEPKTVAIALVTDEVEAWYDYLRAQGVEMKYKYKSGKGRPYDSFVALDPEGYFLEFERFNDHPENEKLIPVLKKNETLFPLPNQKTTVPPELGINSMVTWLYYKDMTGMQRFYENVLGLQMIVDQGWVKIYQVSATGFVGLVDETRGMHSYTETKGVTVSFILDDLKGWFSYVKRHESFELRSKNMEKDEQGRYRAFVGYDPEGYFMEFDRFYNKEGNERLMGYLVE